MIKLSKILSVFTTIFLIFVFSFPRVLPNIKILLLGILIMLFVANKKFNPKVLLPIYLYSLFFIVPLFVSSMNGNEVSYIIGLLKVYFIFPVVLVFVFQCFSKKELEKIIYNSAIISLIVITTTSLSTFLQGLGYFPVNLNAIFYKDEDRIGLNEGYVHIINSPLSYYLFLIPIVFSNSKDFNLKNIKLYLFIILFIFAIITGRRILLLPFLIVIIYQFRKFYKIFIICGVAFFLFLSSSENKFENFDPSEIFSRYESAINSTGDSSVREEQSIHFKKYIAEKPITGYGLGAYMGSYLRNDEFRVAYEKSYHYLVFCMGIPFAFLLFVFYLFLLFKAWRFSEDSLIYKGIFFGVISLLLASYTNPYWLSSFDYTIPFAILITISSQLTTWKKFMEQ